MILHMIPVFVQARYGMVGMARMNRRDKIVIIDLDVVLTSSVVGLCFLGGELWRLVGGVLWFFWWLGV